MIGYGIDAPGIIRGFALAAAGLLVGAGLLGWLGLPVLAMVASVFAIGPLGLACSMLLYGLVGKFRVRDRMLAAIAWRGDETVLDVGTGRGLLLVGAAKRVPRGRAVGVDLWRAEDLSRNAGPASALANAAAEGVTVEVLTGDATALTLPGGSVDVVLSLLCLHNIPHADGRATACAEIARVLKPGGVALIGDYTGVPALAGWLRDAGLSVEAPRSWVGTALGPMRVVRAGKPG